MPGGTVSGLRVLLDTIEHAYSVSGPFLTVFWHLLEPFYGSSLALFEPEWDQNKTAHFD